MSGAAVFTLATLLVGLDPVSAAIALPTSRAASGSCYAMQTQPRQPEAYTALYRLAQGHWTCTHTLYLGDRALVILRFKWRPSSPPYDRGWGHPAARTLILKDGARYVLGHYTVGSQGLLFVSSPMPFSRGTNGFTRFRLRVDIPRKAAWVGRRRIDILVAKGSALTNFGNSSAMYGFSVDPVPSIYRSPPQGIRRQ